MSRPRSAPTPIEILARWPLAGLLEADASVQEGVVYARRLLKELLKRHPRLTITSVIMSTDSANSYSECMARLKLARRRGTIDVIASGANPTEARLNAELFAIRQATLGREVPVLGCLLKSGRLQVDLELEDGSSPLDTYKLIVTQDARTDSWPWLPAPVLPQDRYEMRVSMSPLNENKRSRYLVVHDLHPDIKALAGPWMVLGQRVYLHRLIAALGGRMLNRVDELNPVREALELPTLDDPTLQVHHLNGMGYDNRLSNLSALTREGHMRRHMRWMTSLNDLGAGTSVQGGPSKWCPPPLIVTTPSDFAPDDLPGHLGNSGFSGAGSPQHEPLNAPQMGTPDLQPKPVTGAELARYAGRSDKARNWCKALKALASLGGKGTLSAIHFSISRDKPSPNTLRSAFSSLESLGIVKITGLEAGGKTGQGTHHHYELLRPLAQDLMGRKARVGRSS